jgi:hypothetical protein
MFLYHHSIFTQTEIQALRRFRQKVKRRINVTTSTWRKSSHWSRLWKPPENWLLPPVSYFFCLTQFSEDIQWVPPWSGFHCSSTEHQMISEVCFANTRILQPPMKSSRRYSGTILTSETKGSSWYFPHAPHILSSPFVQSFSFLYFLVFA